MAGRGGLWRALAGALALAGLVVLVAVVAQALDLRGPVSSADFAGVLIAAAAGAAGVIAWSKRPRPDASAPVRADVTTAAEVLADRVREQWEAEARRRLLDDPEPIPVRWQLTSDEAVMSSPRLITAQTEFTFAGRSDDIAALAAAFRGLARRRLVITGGAGMGKTTLAIQLLLRLLATRAADRAAATDGEVVPVPVLLPVSGWDLRTYSGLREWLADRLAQDYPPLNASALGPGAAAALVAGGHILPVLDGLDEIGETARAEVITALNTSLNANDQVIVTSRTTEFATAVTAAGRPLTGAAVILPAMLSPQAGVDYLSACLPAAPTNAWRKVLATLTTRAAPGLTEMAATPLGLWLIRIIYTAPDANPAPLAGPLGGDAATLRAHLLDQIIPALIKARPPSTDPGDHFRPRHRLDPDATRRYLTYLARAFPPATTRDIAWWRIAATVPHIRCIIGLAAGLAFGLAFGLTFGLTFGLAAGPTAGLAFGLTAGPVFGHMSKTWADEGPGHADLRLRGRRLSLLRALRGNQVAGRAVGLAVGLAAGLTVGFAAGPTAGLEAGLTAGFGIGVLSGILSWLVGALVSGLVEWAEDPILTSISTPRSSWQSDMALTLLRWLVGLAFGLMTGLVGFAFVGLAFGLAFGLTTGLAFMLAFGLAAGLAAGSLMGKHHAWLACTIATGRLALARRLPWRTMSFLDDAHRLGLLRAVGPIYQFRHAALHDHLAAAAPPDCGP